MSFIDRPDKPDVTDDRGSVRKIMSATTASIETAWHAKPPTTVLEHLTSSAKGLTSHEAAERLARLGPNRLPSRRGRSAIARLAAQFNNVLIYVLLVSAAITAMLGHLTDAAVILLVVIANAVIGFIQEGRAEDAMAAIQSLVSPQAVVIREGVRTTVDATLLVPGDVVWLEAGDRVPADIRLLQARSLRIDESALTGESVPIGKVTEPVGAEAALADRKSMAYSGCLVAAGHGTGVVVATGSDTELGRITKLLSTVQVLETPLIRQMNRFARQLTFAILLFALVVFLFAVYMRGYAWADAFLAVVSLAVALIPEGLPAVMTITLAIGVRRMAERNAIIRRLPAVETLGSVGVICSDKTGTLTKNEMTVRAFVTADATYDVSGVGYDPAGSLSVDGKGVAPHEWTTLVEAGRCAVLCNDARLHHSKQHHWRVDGDPMEGALLAFGTKLGRDLDDTRREFGRVNAIPFDAEHRFMATLHRSARPASVIYVKGAPERVIAMCAQELASTGTRALDRERWSHQVETLASSGQRVLALAMKHRKGDSDTLRFEDVMHDLTLLGLVGLIDPPRDEAIAAVRQCREAGIDVKMITGDHAATAVAIAEQLALSDQVAAMTGAQLDALDPTQLAEVASSTSVFARTSPENKLKLVSALQACGAVIAMTGDGVNDAPALKRADVGVAMGRKGTEAAKQAADMVLADDNFASIAAAVREGRTVYDNLRKVISWTLPTNGGEALCVVAAILFGATLPVTPVQILWINLVTSVTLGLTLAFEPSEPNVMQRPPRVPGEPLISRFLLWRICLVSLLFVLGAFGLFEYAIAQGASLEAARTVAVNTIVVLEIFYLFAVRYSGMTSITWRGVLGTKAVWIGIVSITVLQAMFTYVPFMQSWFGTQAIGPIEIALMLGVGIAVLLVLEVEKWALRSRQSSAEARGDTGEDEIVRTAR
jgi:magnesium-transporting ATPase (P-type)